jgi:hypothetical protein
LVLNRSRLRRVLPVRPSNTAIARGVSRGFLAFLLVACTLAAGCSTATVGLQKDGSYILDNGEQSMDCQRLSNSLWGHLQVLKALPARARAEREAVAPTAAQAVGRWFGGSSPSLESLKEYDRERAHVRSLHRNLISKGCPPLDIERELAETDAAVAPYR